MKKNYFLSFSILLIIFFISLIMRWDFIGTLSEGHHQFSTAQLILYIENWFFEGIKENNFLSIWIPKSIDYINIIERVPYVSYPIGSQLIIFSIKLLFQNLETIKLIQFTSAFVHYLIVVLIYIFIIKIDFKLDFKIKNAFAIVGATSYIFLPSPFYYHLMLFNYDTIIILPFVAILLFEYLIRAENKKKLLIIQSIIFFISGFLDHFAIIIGLSIFLFRILYPIKGIKILENFIQILIPITFPFLVHLYHLYSNEFLLILFNKFLNRTGINYAITNIEKPYYSFIYSFWIKKLHIYLPLFLISIIFLYKNLNKLLFKKNISYLVILIGFVSCTLYSLLLQNYAAIHDFAALKFYPLISITILSLIPLTILENKNYIYSNQILKKILNFRNLVFFSMGLIFIFIVLDNSIRIIWLKNTTNPYLKIKNYNVSKIFFYAQFPRDNIYDDKFLKFIRDNSNFEDIYLSFTDIEITRNPPTKLSVARKIINKVNSEEKLINLIAKLPKSVKLKVIINKKNDCLNEIEYNKRIEFNDFLILSVLNKKYNLLTKCI